ncbi:MAG: radical SAM protein [Candidatus Woesearchaeota archaeon]
MSLVQVIEEQPNFLLFENIDGEVFFYELLMRSLQKHNPETKSLLDQLRNINIPTIFDYDKGSVLKDIGIKVDALIISLTSRCNLRCDYCIYSGNYTGIRQHSKSVSGDITDSVFEKALDFFEQAKHENSRLTFYGGEPLIRFDLIKRARERFPQTTMNLTSNLLLGERYVTFLVENNILLSISLDGPREIHDAHRHTKNYQGSFEKVMKAIEILRQDPDYFQQIPFLVTLSEPHKIKEIREFFEREFPHNPVIISLIEPKNILRYPETYNRENMQVYSQYFLEMAREFIDAKKQGKPISAFLNSFFNPLIYSLSNRELSPFPNSGKLPLQGICRATIEKLFLDSTGTFYLCEKMDGHSSVGNIFTGIDKEKVLNLYEAYKNFRNTYCTECWARRECSLCFLVTQDGELTNPENISLTCNMERESILRGLSLISSIYG